MCSSDLVTNGKHVPHSTSVSEHKHNGVSTSHAREVETGVLTSRTALNELNQQYERFFEEVVQVKTDVTPDTVCTILNLGCGTFPTYPAVRRLFPRTQIIGFDLHKPSLHCAKVATASDKNTSIVKHDIISPPKSYLGKLSLVVLNHPPHLDHLMPPIPIEAQFLPPHMAQRFMMAQLHEAYKGLDSVLRSVESVLKPGGTAVFTFPVKPDFDLYSVRLDALINNFGVLKLRVVDADKNQFGTVRQTRHLEFGSAADFISTVKEGLLKLDTDSKKLTYVRDAINKYSPMTRPIAELIFTFNESYEAPLYSGKKLTIEKHLEFFESMFRQKSDADLFKYNMHAYYLIVQKPE